MNNKQLDPETKRILNYFKWKLEPAEFREWWEIEKQAKQEAQNQLAEMALKEEKEWGEIKVFARKEVKHE